MSTRRKFLAGSAGAVTGALPILDLVRLRYRFRLALRKPLTYAANGYFVLTPPIWARRTIGTVQVFPARIGEESPCLTRGRWKHLWPIIEELLGIGGHLMCQQVGRSARCEWSLRQFSTRPQYGDTGCEACSAVKAIFRLSDRWTCRKPRPAARRRWNLRSPNPNHQFTSRLMCCALPLSRRICSTGDLSFVLGAAERCGIAPSRGLVFSAAEVLDEIFGSSQREGENADRGRFVGAIQEDAGITDV